MKHNMGKTDRIIRFIVAAIFIYAIISRSVGGAIAVILGILAVLLVVTAVFGYCPPYALLGVKTCRCEDHDKEKAASS